MYNGVWVTCVQFECGVLCMCACGGGGGDVCVWWVWGGDVCVWWVCVWGGGYEGVCVVCVCV